MKIYTTYMLEADEGKLLRNKENGAIASAIWLSANEQKDDWEEIDIPAKEDQELSE